MESLTANSSMSFKKKFKNLRAVCFPVCVNYFWVNMTSKPAPLPGHRVDHQKPVVSSSCLDNDGKVSLSQALVVLGGKLVNTWSQECTHLVMTTAKVTIKVRSQALAPRYNVKLPCP